MEFPFYPLVVIIQYVPGYIFSDSVIGLGGAPLLSIRITSCSAGVVQSSILVGEGKYTGLT